MTREVLLLVDALAREKNVEKDIVFIALESALASATKKRFHEDADVRVSIDPQTGDYQSLRRWQVVPDDAVEEPARQIALSEALQRNPEIKLEEYIEEVLEPVEFGRIGAQAAKQVIFQKIRDAEREQILNDFLEREEALVTGTIKRMERGNAIVESGRVEARAAARPDDPQGESARRRPCARLYPAQVDRNARGPQIDLVAHRAGIHDQAVRAGSAGNRGRPAGDQGGRAGPGFARQDRGQVQRSAIDPIGTCVGMRGSRVQAVTGELARRARGHHIVVGRSRHSS